MRKTRQRTDKVSRSRAFRSSLECLENRLLLAVTHNSCSNGQAADLEILADGDGDVVTLGTTFVQLVSGAFAETISVNFQPLPGPGPGGFCTTDQVSSVLVKGDADADSNEFFSELDERFSVTLEGGGGDDFLAGEVAATMILGGDGNDEIEGSEGPDVLDGGAGDDLIFGLGGDDFITGRNGDDLLDGGDGSDTLDPGTGEDQADGGDGDDVFLLGNGNTIVVDSGGFDSVDFSLANLGITIDLNSNVDQTVNSTGNVIRFDNLIENFAGGPLADTVTVGPIDNTERLIDGGDPVQSPGDTLVVIPDEPTVEIDGEQIIFSTAVIIPVRFETVSVENRFDYGDAPNSFGTTNPTAARHLFVPGVHLGTKVDLETDGIPSPNAGTDSFDDGVSFPEQLSPGTRSDSLVEASVSGTLNAWYDWDLDGTFASRPIEEVFNAAVSGGENTVGVSVPGDFPNPLPPGKQLYARYRFSKQGGLGPTGEASSGEVEDYLVSGQIVGTKYLDSNGDGVRNVDADPDSGEFEPGLEGVTIFLDLNHNGDFDSEIDASTVTDGDGRFSFTVLPGSYDIFEIEPDGFAQTAAPVNPIVVGHGQTRDLAGFGNTTVSSFDFGDLPSPFATTSAQGGPRHQVVSGVFLGNTVDVEPDGQPDPDALSDDLSGGDEDGIRFLSSFKPGTLAQLEVTASISGFLYGWFDFDANGAFDGGEQVFHDLPIPAGLSLQSFQVPSDAISAGHARFRFTSTAALGLGPNGVSSTGEVPDGEVEDYALVDFGDAPESYATRRNSQPASDGPRHLISPEFYLGSVLTDHEPDGQPDLLARGDDTAGQSDENGIRFLTGLVAGETAELSVTANQAGFLSGWIDFDGNVQFQDTPSAVGGERILSSESLAAGTQTVSFTVPDNITIAKFARFRFTNEDIVLGPVGLKPDGSLPLGEVEDYAVLDFGDAPLRDASNQQYATLDKHDGPRHFLSTIFLGDSAGDAPNAEVDAKPNRVARGDDFESGVHFASSLVPGETVEVTVTASAQGKLDGFVDFNNNGSWEDAGEKVFDSEDLQPGANILSVSVPDDAEFAALAARFRFSDAGGLGPIGDLSSGEIPDGEVEDYLVGLVVNSTGNAPDLIPGDNLCDTGGTVMRPSPLDPSVSVEEPECTLTAAIQEANTAAFTAILFAIPQNDIGFDPASNSFTIVPDSALPTITRQVLIDATSQEEYDQRPVIALDGSSAGSGANGLTISADDSRLLGIAIGGFAGSGVHLDQVERNRIELSYFGTDVAGANPIPNGNGITLDSSSQNVVRQSVISGNTLAGVLVTGVEATLNDIAGSLIGTSAEGNAELPNGIGVHILGAAETLVGGDFEGDRNVISGNGTGILIEGLDAKNNIVRNNLVGTDATGQVALGNSGTGIHIVNSSNNRIDFAPNLTTFSGNLISGNLDGVLIEGNEATGNLVLANRLGTNLGGETRLPNTRYGIHILNAPSNSIGVTGDDFHQNLVSGNSEGIRIEGPDASFNVVGRNLIGTNGDGDEAIGNTLGIHILNAPNNMVGTNLVQDSFRNTVSGNQTGIRIEGSDATGNVLAANSIGLTADTSGTVGNTETGIHILNASANFVGAESTSGNGLLPNVVSGNKLGIHIQGNQASGNIIGRNFIGTDSLGDPQAPLFTFGNSEHGVLIEQAPNNIVGTLQNIQPPPVIAPGNVIAGNGGNGVTIIGQQAVGNQIRRNSMFVNGGLGIDLGNDGVTANLPEDLDTGPNELQNFPRLLRIESATVHGELRSATNSTYQIDLYLSHARNPSGHGEGETWSATTTVTTDDTGKAEFSFPNAFTDTSPPIATATATDSNGNTSEFSASLSAPDLKVTSVTQLRASDVRRNGQRFLLPISFTISNIGADPATNAVIQSVGNGRELVHQVVSLDPQQSMSFNADWDVTTLLSSGGGLAELELEVVADPDGDILELRETNNSLERQLTVDAKPNLLVKHGFKPGFFVQGVSLENPFDAFVDDWNGDLNDSLIADSDQLIVTYTLNGSTTALAAPNAAEAPATSHPYDMGIDLQKGSNILEVQSKIGNFPWFSEITTIELTGIGNAPWLAGLLLDVSGEPSSSTYDKTAVYETEFSFPDSVTEGFFQLPSSLSFMAGPLGPSFGEFSIQVEFRSDGVATLDGSASFSGEVARRQILPEVEIEVNGTATVGDDLDLELEELVATISLSGDIGTPNVPLPPPFSFLSVSAGIEANLTTTISIEQQPDGSLEFGDLEFEIPVSATATLTAGISGIASVSGTLGLTVTPSFTLPPGDCLLDELTLQFFVRGEVEFLIFSESLEARFPDPPFELFGCGSSFASPGFAPSSFTFANATAPSPATAGPFSSSQSALPSFSTVASLQSGTALPQIDFSRAAPRLAQGPDNQMTLVYVDEDPNKREGQRYEVFASIFDRDEWSTPVALSGDNLIDYYPTVAYDNGRPIAMWTRVRNPVANPAGIDPKSVLGETEIVYSIHDPATGTWSSPILLTDNSLTDVQPRLQSGGNGNLMAVWVHDTDNDTPIFPGDDVALSSELMFSSFDGEKFSAPQVAVSGAKTNSAPQFAAKSGESILLWSEDANEDNRDNQDRSIVASIFDGATWSARTPVADSPGIPDIDPRVVYDASGVANVIWVRRGVPLSESPNDVTDRIMFSTFDGAFSQPEIAADVLSVIDPELVVAPNGNLIVVWQGTSSAGSDVFYAIRDGSSGVWSSPTQFTNSDSLEWALNPFINQAGELEVLYLERGLQSESVTLGPPPGASFAPSHAATASASAPAETSSSITVPVFANSGLNSASGQLGHDLQADDIVLSEPNPAPGSTVTVTTAVTNTGDFIAPASVLLLDNGTPFAQLETGMIRPGQSVTVDAPWQVSGSGPHSLLAVVDPDNEIAEKDETNNEASQLTTLPDLVVIFAQTIVDADTITVSSAITNTGTSIVDSPFEVALRLDSPEGTTIATTQVRDSLIPGQTTELVFTLDDPASLLDGAHAAWIVADSTNVVPESGEGNNTNLTALNVLPDLIVVEDSSGSFIIRNIGFIEATDVDVVVSQNTPTGSVVFQTTVPALTPGNGIVLPLNLPGDGSTLVIQADPSKTILEIDESNNRHVEQLDFEPPAIQAEDVIREATSSDGAQVNFSLDILDNIDPTPSLACSHSDGDMFPIGSTTVDCMVTDAAGNSSSTSFAVTVSDTAAPTLSGIPEHLTLDAASILGTIANFTLPVASDALDPTPVVECNPESGSLFAVGTTEVSCIATDSSANSSSGSFRVTVNPFVEPKPTVLVGQNGNVLTVLGDGQDNRVRIRKLGADNVEIRGLQGTLINGRRRQVFPRPGQFRFRMRSGNDLVWFDGKNDFQIDIVNANMGPGEDFVRFDKALVGKVIVNAGGGDDRIRIVDSLLSKLGRLNASGGDDTTTVLRSSIRNLDFHARNGKDRVFIEDSHLQGTTAINLGHGADTLAIDRQSKSQGRFGPRTSVHLGSGDDHVFIGESITVSRLFDLAKENPVVHGGPGFDRLDARSLCQLLEDGSTLHNLRSVEQVDCRD